MVTDECLLPIFCGEIMPKIYTSWPNDDSSSWMFCYAAHGRRVREIHVPIHDEHSVLVIPLPRPMHPDDVAGFRSLVGFQPTLEPICYACGGLVETTGRCSKISKRYTCDACRGDICLDCDRTNCVGWMHFHPEQADYIRRGEDPIGW